MGLARRSPNGPELFGLPLLWMGMVTEVARSRHRNELRGVLKHPGAAHIRRAGGRCASHVLFHHQWADLGCMAVGFDEVGSQLRTHNYS